MTQSLVHRGPDGEGIWNSEDKKVSFGHRRLSVIDLTVNASQPMQYLNRYTITFNGEIYNYLELRETLVKKGYRFSSQSDTEIIPAMYDLYRESCLQHFDGMFSFAIWDNRNKTLFCARDRFGEKPFYYLHDSSHFIFASEMKALFAANVPCIPDRPELLKFLVHATYPIGEKTFFHNVFSLPASHYLTITDNGKISFCQYWDISGKEGKSTQGTDKDICGSFLELFNESVSKRLRSDVPVGSCFSGGIDSSAVVCTINTIKNKSQDQKTFSARFNDENLDEGKWMKHIFEITPIEPHFTWPSPEILSNDLDLFFYHQEEPVVSASPFAQWCVMRLAKEHNVTVLLDGQGSDELLAGYHHFYFIYYSELLRNLRILKYLEEKKYFRKHFLDSFEHIFSLPYGSLLKHAIKSFFPSLTGSAGINHYTDIHPDVMDNYRFNPPYFYKPKTLHEALRTHMFQSGLSQLLRFADRNSMAHSREVRLPFLYHKLVEYVFSLPSSWKIRNGWTKFILRESMKNIVPDLILKRKDKIGFEPPEKSWLAHPVMQDRLNSARNFLVSEKWLDKNIKRPIIWRELMAAMFLRANFSVSAVKPS